MVYLIHLINHVEVVVVPVYLQDREGVRCSNWSQGRRLQVRAVPAGRVPHHWPGIQRPIAVSGLQIPSLPPSRSLPLLPERDSLGAHKWLVTT
jgi:hypothetical protein